MFKLFRKIQRAIDIKILWPMCLKEAKSLNQAKYAFSFHCFNDPAWTKDMTGEEIYNFINKLPIR